MAYKTFWQWRIVGLSPLGYAAQSIGTAISLNERVAIMAKNGGKASGILTIDQLLKPEQRTQIQNTLNKQAASQDRLFVLEAGMTYQQTSLSPSDMQLLENRRFQIEDIARFMGVPSVLINDTSGSTTWGSGIGQIVQGFEKLNLRPYAERIEASIKRSLMPISDWETIEIEFDFDALLRGDKKTRADALSVEINSGQTTPNEARRQEGKKQQEGGDVLLVNSALVPVDTIQKNNEVGNGA